MLLWLISSAQGRGKRMFRPFSLKADVVVRLLFFVEF